MYVLLKVSAVKKHCKYDIYYIFLHCGSPHLFAETYYSNIALSNNNNLNWKKKTIEKLKKNVLCKPSAYTLKRSPLHTYLGVSK